MPGRQYTSDNYRYGYNGMEKDDEVKGNGNSLDFGARIYDPRIGRWLSMDPERQFDLSQYLSFANNPILLTDPDGGWVPGVDNNGRITLTAEKGDNISTLYSFFGGKSNASKYLPSVYMTDKAGAVIEIPEGQKIRFNSENIFSKTMSYYTENKEKFDSKPTYDCKDLCSSLVLQNEAKTDTRGTGGTTSDLASFGTTWKTKEETEEQVFGETFSYWSYTPPLGDHAAISFGKDKNGMEYFFTKNGKSGALEIMSLKQLEDIYNLFDFFRTEYKLQQLSGSEQPNIEMRNDSSNQ